MTSGMVSVEAHRAEVLAAIRPLEPANATLEEARGCVLAEDTHATVAVPPFENSAMDGYAVYAADVEQATPQAPVTLPVIDQVPAGDTRTLTVPPGSCVRIMTGAMLPSGPDTVIPVEWTDGGRERAAFHRSAPRGNAVRPRGSDIADGDLLLPAGALLGPAQIALLAAAGQATASVRPSPRVAIIATGNELAEPGQPLRPGQIWESNSYLLASAVRQAGGTAERHRVPDDANALLAEIEAQARRCDLLITAGGVSMGAEHDVVKAALSGRESVTFRKVAMQPGMPQGFGVVGATRTPLVMLPGNPVSAFVSFHVFVRPALDALRGLPPQGPAPARATLTGPVTSPEGRRSYLRGVLDAASGSVTPLTGQGSHQLGSLARANALIVVPEEVSAMAAGDDADVVSLP